MHDVAAADDQNSSLSQRREPAPEIEVKVEVLPPVDRELHDRDIRFGKRVHQDRPGAVIDAPAIVVEPDVRWFDDLRDLLGLGHPRLESSNLGVSHACELSPRLAPAQDTTSAAAERLV